MGRCNRNLWQGLKPAFGMVLVQISFAGVNIFYKLAINDGMDMRILVAYRYLFASAFLCPLAFFLERKSRPSMTWKILTQAFFCGLFGLRFLFSGTGAWGVDTLSCLVSNSKQAHALFFSHHVAESHGALAQNLYVSSVKLTSATFASAMTNLIPAITFVMAVIFSLESLGIKALSGQAKVLGTLVGVGGAMVLTFYKGADVNLWSSKLDLIKPSHGGASSPHQESGNRVMGSLLAVASCFSYAIWLIIQAKMSTDFPCHYSTTALMCSMAAVQAAVFAVCVDRSWEQWRLGFNIRLLTVVYVGVVASALILTVMSWCITQRGPLYASVFNPLMLVIVAILGSLLLGEKLHVGSIIGAVLIVIGLYIVLWGKGKEAVKVAELPANETLDIVIAPGKSEPQGELELKGKKVEGGLPQEEP